MYTSTFITQTTRLCLFRQRQVPLMSPVIMSCLTGNEDSADLACVLIYSETTCPLSILRKLCADITIFIATQTTHNCLFLTTAVTTSVSCIMSCLVEIRNRMSNMLLQLNDSTLEIIITQPIISSGVSSTNNTKEACN